MTHDSVSNVVKAGYKARYKQKSVMLSYIGYLAMLANMKAGWEKPSKKL